MRIGRHQKYAKVVPLGAAFVALMWGCGDVEEASVLALQEHRGETQGTTYLVKYMAEDALPQAGIDSILSDMDEAANLWLPTSIISQVNDWSNTDSVFSFEDHSFIFSSLWLMSEALHRQTQGAFDPTVLPLVNLWGFGLTERGQVTQEQVDSTLRYVGMSMGVMDLNHKEENLRITETQIRKKYAESKLDFNSIAQGFTVDLILEWLMDQGVNHAMVEIGGEVRCIGLNDRQEAWHIAIDQPIMSDASDRQLEAIIAVKDFAICTSGNYRKFYEEDGIRRSHTIDPQSGFPVDHGMLSATIRAQSAAKADALATACMVMGPSDAERFIEGYQREFPEERLEAVFLIAGEEGKWDTWMTKGWEDSFIPLH